MLAGMAAAVVGCDKSVNVTGNVKPAEPSKYITVATGIGTRVTVNEAGEETFAEGDVISIYAWADTPPVIPAADGRVVNNSLNTLKGGVWNAEPQMLWKNPVDPHYFIGIYPATTTPVADLQAGDYSIDISDQTRSDLLVATRPEGVRSTENPVVLEFNHVMAKLIVNLAYRSQWNGTPNVESVMILGAATTAKVNYYTRVVTPGTGTPDVGMPLPMVRKNERYESVIIPQTGLRTIIVRIDGKNYIYTHASDITLESGEYTTVNLIVGRDKVTLGDITIKDWAEGAEITGGEASSD